MIIHIVVRREYDSSGFGVVAAFTVEALALAVKEACERNYMPGIVEVVKVEVLA